jgi:hypothetical protein
MTMREDDQRRGESPTSMGEPDPRPVPPPPPVPPSAERPGSGGLFGTAPDGDDSFGPAPQTPGTTPNPNPAPRPAPAGGRNAAVLIGALVVVLVIIATIVGFAAR